MIKICDYPCNNKKEADKEEDRYMMNTHKASRTNKQYREDNKDIINEKMKEYRENNKDTINEKNKQYRENNKDKINEKITCRCGCEVNKKHIARHQTSKKHMDLINQIQ